MQKGIKSLTKMLNMYDLKNASQEFNSRIIEKVAIKKSEPSFKHSKMDQK